MKGGSLYDMSLRYGVCQFWEPAQIGVVPMVHLERVREQARLRSHHPLHSTGLGPETDWNPDWSLAGLQTTA
jgi:hypothetical protein